MLTHAGDSIPAFRRSERCAVDQDGTFWKEYLSRICRGPPRRCFLRSGPRWRASTLVVLIWGILLKHVGVVLRRLFSTSDASIRCTGYLYTGDKDGSLRVWSIADGGKVRKRTVRRAYLLSALVLTEMFLLQTTQRNHLPCRRHGCTACRYLHHVWISCSQRIARNIALSLLAADPLTFCRRCLWSVLATMQHYRCCVSRRPIPER